MRALARCVAAAFLLSALVSATTEADPFAWLQTVRFDAAERGRLNRGEVVVRVLPAADAEIGILASSRLDADSETLAAWASSIAQLKKSPYVLVTRRFSDPPTLDDLQALRLDEGDLNDLRRCIPGDCGLKLAASEILSLRETAAGGGHGWRDGVQDEFRQLVLRRVLAYQDEGIAALPLHADRRRAVDPKAALAALIGRSPFLASDLFTGAATESFFYWSKEQYGTGKPVVGVTHVAIVRPRIPSALGVAVVSQEILATHYRNASFSVTAITEDEQGQRYLVYVNRSQLDVLGGLFGGWKRAIVEGRLKNESASIFSEVRRRLESGPPPE